MRLISLRASRRLPPVLMAFALLASSINVVAAADQTGRFTASPLKVKATGTIVGDLSKAPRSSDGKVAVIIKLAADSVASYTGDIAGLSATDQRPWARRD